jgi:aminoglycoside 2''-phosphotransferase
VNENLKKWDEYSFDELIDLIKENFTEISILKTAAIDKGWNNKILLINDHIAFRFPRTGYAINKLIFEFILLSHLKDFPFEFPSYKLFDMDQKCYGQYEFIEGCSLEDTKTLTADLSNEFLSYFRYMKAIDPTNLDVKDLQKYNPKTWIVHQNDLITKFKNALSDYIDTSYFLQLSELADYSLNSITSEDITLIHGDLYKGNVIVSEDHNHIKGIIDWSDACIGDFALDLAAIGVNFSMEQIKNLIRSTCANREQDCLKRIFFYIQLEPLYEAYYLVKTKNFDLTKVRCEKIRENWDKMSNFVEFYEKCRVK